jgi:hypothetical protein
VEASCNYSKKIIQSNTLYKDQLLLSTKEKNLKDESHNSFFMAGGAMKGMLVCLSTSSFFSSFAYFCRCPYPCLCKIFKKMVLFSSSIPIYLL